MINRKKGLAKVEIITEIDNITGEILNSTRTEKYEQYTSKKHQHNFKMFLDDNEFNSLFYKLKTALDFKVVFFLVDYTNRKDNSLLVDVDLKQKLANGLGYSIKAIEKSITNLVSVNALTPIGRGKYLINPELIFIGGTVNIDNRIEEYNSFRNTYLDKKNKND